MFYLKKHGCKHKIIIIYKGNYTYAKILIWVLVRIADHN